MCRSLSPGSLPSASRRFLPLVFVVAAGGGCAEGVDAPRPVLEGDGFFDSPWPSDLRRDVDGWPDMTGFPKRDEVSLLDDYMTVAEGLEGFGNNAPVYFRFHNTPDLDLLPDEAGSLAGDAAVFLVDVDADSPWWGERVPIRWSFQEEDTEYQPDNLLAVAPVFGFPLRPSTTYAAVILEPLARATEAFGEVWDTDHPDHAHYAPLEPVLDAWGIRTADVAVATVFTTQDPVHEMAEYASYIREDLALPSLESELVLLEDYASYDLYEGWTWLPLFQEGERPYGSEGGALARNDQGGPVVDRWEYVRFSLAVPVNAEPPESGWPLYLYSHGTGGDYITYADSGYVYDPANILANRGFVGLGIDQPLHGLRATASTDPEYHTFNYANPDAARTNIRQGALDEIFLAETLHRNPPVFTTEAHGEVAVDPDRILFLGHSQGGLVGAMAAPFVGDRIRAAVLSGAGGGLSLTITDRTEGYDIPELLRSVIDADDDEVIDEFHPVIGVLQWLTDVTDPLNYAPWWFARDPYWETAPLHVLMTEGLLDGYTPYRTTEALAAAGRVPVLEPAETDPLAHELRELATLARPTEGASTSHEGGSITAGLAQYADQGHFAIFSDTDAISLYAGFLESASVEDPPEIPE